MCQSVVRISLNKVLGGAITTTTIQLNEMSVTGGSLCSEVRFASYSMQNKKHIIYTHRMYVVTWNLFLVGREKR